jgi:type I restriction enzyme R subunit
MCANRPAIPAEIVREVLFESGHRCAVCGTPCPLERAHVIPWHKSREHKAEDLICLCPNCHERADKEKWGEKTLRKYKQMPWVLRHNTDMRGATTRLQIVIHMELEHFDEKNLKWLKYAIAEFLGILPYQVLLHH